ncbi:MAG TPA: RES family NAD+ phosphorylase [Candidatus Limnocylindrales bacterium]|nr:RES family NAD+ phosphorylase [Candidatus Limnocylindrales bacterium]
MARPGADALALTPEPADGRWQRGEAVRALYLADSETTAWAEWYRHSSELGVAPQTRLPRVMWRFEVDLEDVADLTDPAQLAAHGVDHLLPTRRQWPLTQPIGEAYWRAGRRGLLAPSAAHVGGRVLVIFRPTAEAPAGVEQVPRPRRYRELPPLPTGLRT